MFVIYFLSECNVICPFADCPCKGDRNRRKRVDEALRLTPPRVLSLEQAIDFIDTDELLEVTPDNLRIRKKILDPKMRKRSNLK